MNPQLHKNVPNRLKTGAHFNSHTHIRWFRNFSFKGSQANTAYPFASLTKIRDTCFVISLKYVFSVFPAMKPGDEIKCNGTKQGTLER